MVLLVHVTGSLVSWTSSPTWRKGRLMARRGMIRGNSLSNCDRSKCMDYGNTLRRAIREARIAYVNIDHHVNLDIMSIGWGSKPHTSLPDLHSWLAGVSWKDDATSRNWSACL